MNFAQAFYAAVSELRDGGIHEATVEEQCDLDDGGNVTLRIILRRFDIERTTPELEEPG